MKAKMLEKQLKTMYDVADVSLSYKYWFYKLLALTIPAFEYEGLPDSLPAREIELQLQLTNHCTTFMHNGEIVTAETNIFYPDKYYQPTKYTYANPVMGGHTGNLDDPGVCLIWNNCLKDTIGGVDVDSSLLTFIMHYARQLADLSSTINIYTVNSRLTTFPVAKSDSVRASIQKFFDAIALGKREVINDDNIALNKFAVEVADAKRTPDTLKDFIQCKDNILEQFFRDLGIKFRQNKRAQMTEEEIESDDQVLLISLDDMLKARQEGLKRFNEVYGLNASVKINEKYKRPENVQSLAGGYTYTRSMEV